MDEYRNGSPGQSGFPGELSTVGITSLVLIWHPYHVKEFEMTCEAQRTDKVARLGKCASSKEWTSQPE
jgi:hypothetical protein